MKIGEKEIGFLYTVGAYCDYLDWCAQNGSSSLATAEIVKAEVMSRAYAKANNTKDFITIAEMRNMMRYELDDILAEVKKAEEAGSKRKVETTETPKKTADK